MPGACKQGEEKMGKMKENEDLNRKDDKKMEIKTVQLGHKGENTDKKCA